MFEAFTTSTAIVTLAEIGDKTQLLAIVLATRFKKPVPIVLGILVATLANHFLAALLGATAAAFLDGMWFRLGIAAGFVAMGLWTLVPDTFDDDDAPKPSRFGPFLTTLVAFFIVEMGDKTQIATIALGARFNDALAVTAGTTLGMMIANVPAVFLGQALIKRVPLDVVRMVAAALLVATGVWLALQTLGIW
ncbi:TMEM165/GDT1 family protein [Novosphingobium sp.]|jgi:putative Ca2+/H+ antiporter (TMEM165/GDT1 family)|uniref:TMEM165/GDT1 family protein n=1 Tax=Novosphingobium sp. TaxID=1874826 RepID=UPI00356957B4|nr:TMEM165/GDT1 family protein [Novosphingobium sp.]